MSTLEKGFLREIKSTTGAFTTEQIDMLKKVPTNGKVNFEDVRAKMPDGTTRTLNALILKVI